MSRVASNYPPVRYTNGHGQLSRSSSNASGINGLTTTTTSTRPINVRSAAPPPVQKETVHACPLCNGEYKDPRVLPCTHTYCYNCIRDKLIVNTLLTCPKCQHQVQPFDDDQLQDLPRNLILSQEWRLTARPILPPPTVKKPVTYQSALAPSPSMAQQQQQQQQQADKRRSITSETVHQDDSVNGIGHQSVAALVNNFSKSTNNGSDAARSSRSSSVSSNQPVVSNLVRIYSEATGPKQQQKSRSSSVASSSKHDELTRIFEQATNRSQRGSNASFVRPTTQAHEVAYEEISWETLVHESTPAAPPFPAQWQSATADHQQPPQATQRPISATPSVEQRSNVDNLRDIIAGIQQHGAGKRSPSFHQVPSRPSTATHSIRDLNEDDDGDDQPGQRTPVQQTMYAMISPRQHSRQGSSTDSVQSGVSSSISRHSPLPSGSHHVPQRISPSSIPQPPPLQQQPQHLEERASSRAPSAASSTRRSSDRFPPPPPPQHVETLDFGGDHGIKARSGSSVSSRSSIYAEVQDPIHSNEMNLLSTERFNPDVHLAPVMRAATSLRANSHLTSSGTSTPTNRPPSVSGDRERPPSRQDQHYLAPTTTMSSNNPTVTSRVDLLLSDQKRLERDIEEQMKRLKHDYDDIRAQITRKESAIHKEVKNISGRLDEDITEHYHRKQKIYAILAADANTVGTELERLRSSPTMVNNKQQLWNNLEQIEMNIRNIRQAVEQQTELRGSLTFAEGRRALGADTIGQITYNQTEPHRRRPSSSPSPPSVQVEQLSTNISPYKYIKIDHLATLEPEAIAITENNKKILLGICNKLFILNEYGDTLKVIQLAPSIRGIAVSKKSSLQNIAYVSHDETVSMIDIDSGESIDSVKETDSTGDSGTFLPLGIDTDNVRGDVYVCDYRNSCVIKFDQKLEFITQWRVYNHSDQYDEARPKLISVYGQRLYMIVEHSCKPYYNQGIAYTFSLHICDANSGNIMKIIDAELLSTQRLRWPCSVQAINHEKCYILDTMTSGKYFNGQWQKHWSRVLEIGQDDPNVVTELFQLDSEAATMAMTKQNMIIAANGDILFVDLGFLKSAPSSEHNYQNLP